MWDLTKSVLFLSMLPWLQVWDLTDSLAELYQAVQRHEAAASSTLRPVPSESTTTSVISHQMSPDIDMRNINVTEWLSRDTNHGFIRVYPPDLSNFNYSQLIPVTDSTSVHRVCIMLGVSLNALHVQLNGDIIRRMDPYEHPLVLQNEYLTGLGYSDIHRIQREGTKEELGYLVRFYAGQSQLSTSVGFILGHRLRRWPNIKPTPGERREKGTWRIGRTPDCLAGHTCVLGSNPADPACMGFSEK